MRSNDGPAASLPTASFSYRVGDDRWDWSDGIYRLHGFVRHELVPTTEVLLAHCHPADRETVAALLRAAVADGRPLVCRYRIIDAARRQHTVVVFATPSRDADGRTQVLEGWMADVTDKLRAEIKEATAAAVDAVTATRGVIDEAKGLLMGRYGLAADEAFAVLTVVSSHTNCKVRHVAAELVELLTGWPPMDTDGVIEDLERALRGRDGKSAAN